MLGRRQFVWCNRMTFEMLTTVFFSSPHFPLLHLILASKQEKRKIPGFFRPWEWHERAPLAPVNGARALTERPLESPPLFWENWNPAWSVSGSGDSRQGILCGQSPQRIWWGRDHKSGSISTRTVQSPFKGGPNVTPASLKYQGLKKLQKDTTIHLPTPM